MSPVAGVFVWIAGPTGVIQPNFVGIVSQAVPRPADLFLDLDLDEFRYVVYQDPKLGLANL